MGIAQDWGLAADSNIQAKKAEFGGERQRFTDAINQSLYGNNQVAGRQTQLADALLAQSQGRGPSLAQSQLQQGLQQGQAAVASSMASQRGINPALAARAVGQQQAMMAQQAAGQSAQLRAQEQMAAQQQLAQALAAQRGQDLGMYQAAGGLNQSQNQLLTGLNMQNSANDLQAQMANANIDQQAAQTNLKLLGAGSSAVGGLLGFGGMAHGGMIPGDHPANDTVPAMLSPGEIVLPRSVAQSEDAPDKAADFVSAITKKKASGESGSGYGAVVAKVRELEAMLKKLGGGK